MDINTATGETVVFAGGGGWPGERATVLKTIDEGAVLTVAQLNVSQSSSTVEFEELPGKRFNTVMFKNNTPTWKRFDWFAHCYMGIPEKTQADFDAIPFDERHMSESAIAQLEGESFVPVQAVVMDVPATPALEPLTIEHVSMFNSFRPSSWVTDVIPVNNKIVTAWAHSHESISVLNPKNEQEVIDLFMEKFGIEPRHFSTVSFGKTFNVDDLLPGTSQRF